MDLPGTLPKAISRPTLAVLDLEAIAFNFRRLSDLLPASAEIDAVVKADLRDPGAARGSTGSPSRPRV
jgi:hypothetical protein